MNTRRGLVAVVAAVALALLVWGLGSAMGSGSTDETPSTSTEPDSSATEAMPGPDAGPDDETDEPDEPDEPDEQTLEFVVSSFNVLGSSHTAPTGNRPAMASGTKRIRWAADLLADHDVEVVGFQEFQVDQQRAFLSDTEQGYDVYPGFALGRKGSQNAIAWRNDRWTLVEGDTVDIPYFEGTPWPMPVVLLEHRETGRTVYFTNFHNPASTPRHPDQGRWRERALALEVALVNRLQDRSRSPVILTGDLNSREPAFCALAEGAGMVASNGGGHDGSCRPPADATIDWIFGSEGLRFTEHRRVESALVQRTTDHPMIVATVRLDPEGAAR